MLPFLLLLRLLECLRWYICGHNLTITFLLDFHNCRMERALAPLNKWILCRKLHWSAKRKKTKEHRVRSGCLEVFYKKAFLKTLKISLYILRRNNLISIYFYTIVKQLQSKLSKMLYADVNSSFVTRKCQKIRKTDDNT